MDKIDIILSESNLIEELDRLEKETIKENKKKTKKKNTIKFPR